MVACNDYTSCLPDCVSGLAYDLLAASALLERIAVVVEAVSTQDCSVKFSLREENRRVGIIFSLRWDFSGWEARGKTVWISADVRHLCRHLDRHLIRHFCRHHFRHPFRHLCRHWYRHIYIHSWGHSFGHLWGHLWGHFYRHLFRHFFGQCAPPFSPPFLRLPDTRPQLRTFAWKQAFNYENHNFQ